MNSFSNKHNYRTISVDKETLDLLEKLWFTNFYEWETVYKIDWYDSRTYVIWFIIWLSMSSYFFITIYWI